MSRLSTAPVLVLDIGNVCLKVEEKAFADILELPLPALDPAGELAQKVISANIEMQKGAITPEEFLKSVSHEIPGNPAPERVKAAWEAIIGAEMAGMADLVDWALDRDLEIFLLSDTCPIHVPQIARCLSFYDKVSQYFFSYEVGAVKPQAGMYEAVEAACEGLPPCLYTDDRPQNIAAAEQRGWPVYHFGSVDGLRQALKRQMSAI